MAPPNLSYPLIVEDYKHHLRSFPDSYLSFQSFCEPYNVRVESVRQWMRRRGIDLSVLYYEVLLERSTSDPSFEIPRPFTDDVKLPVHLLNKSRLPCRLYPPLKF